jgi:hypothetical protein
VHNVTQAYRKIAPNSGAYFNEGDVYETGHQQSYWGANYERLLDIKHKYDPHGILDCWQCGELDMYARHCPGVAHEFCVLSGMERPR